MISKCFCICSSPLGTLSIPECEQLFQEAGVAAAAKLPNDSSLSDLVKDVKFSFVFLCGGGFRPPGPPPTSRPGLEASNKHVLHK